MFSIKGIKYQYRGSSIIKSTTTIYNDIYVSDEFKASGPKLDVSENSAGTFTIKLSPTNNGYSFVEKLTTSLVISKNDNVIWTGRIISIKEDFYNNKTITCEGALAYLNDTIQPQELYYNVGVPDMIRTIIDVHNNQMSSSNSIYKKFNIGHLDDAYYIDGSVVNLDEWYTNYEDTITVLNNIVSTYGGYIKLDYTENSGTTINYYRESNRSSDSQIIEFGQNLLDFTKSYDISDFCTAVLVLGSRLENKYGISVSGIDNVQAYTTMASVNNGKEYYQNDTAVNNYGFLLKKIEIDNENPEQLLEYAKEYLSSLQFDEMTLEVSAADLSYLDNTITELKLHNTVRVRSLPHGLDKVFPVKKTSIPLDNPGNTKFTLTLNIVGKLSANTLSGKAAADIVYTNNSLDRITNDILLKERRNQANLISSFSTGYITITTRDNQSNELYITDQKIPDDWNADDPYGTSIPGAYKTVNKYWRWNLNGLEYVNKEANKKDGVDENTPRLALTMNGEISADFITTGRLNAKVINAGILKNYDCTEDANQFGNNSSRKDIFYLNLEEGVLKMNPSVLMIGGYAAATQSYANSTASSAATNAINNLSGTAIYSKLANAGQGIYASGGNYYINASYIKTGTISADRIYGGTLNIGGNGYGNAYIYVRDSSNYLTHMISNDGLISYGMNYIMYQYKGDHTYLDNKGREKIEYAHNYEIKYGKSGFLSDVTHYDEDAETVTSPIHSMTYYANYIGYYLKGNNKPFAYIGLKGNKKNKSGLADLVIANNTNKLGIGSLSAYIDASSIDMYTYGLGEYQCLRYENISPTIDSENSTYDSDGNIYNGYQFDNSIVIEVVSATDVGTESGTITVSEFMKQNYILIDFTSIRSRYRKGVHVSTDNDNSKLIINSELINKLRNL